MMQEEHGGPSPHWECYNGLIGTNPTLENLLVVCTLHLHVKERESSNMRDCPSKEHKISELIAKKEKQNEN